MLSVRSGKVSGRRRRKSVLELYGQQRVDEVRNGLKEGDITKIARNHGIDRRAFDRVLSGQSSRLDLFAILEKRAKANLEDCEPPLSYIDTGISLNEFNRFRRLFRALQFNDTFKLYIVWKTGKEFKKVKTGIPYWFDSKCFDEFVLFCGKRPKLVRGKLVFDSTDLVETVVTLEKEVERLKGLLSAFGL